MVANGLIMYELRKKEKEGEKEGKKRGGMKRRKGEGRNRFDPQGDVCTTNLATQMMLGTFWVMFNINQS